MLLSFPLGGDPSFETKKDCGQAAMTVRSLKRIAHSIMHFLIMLLELNRHR